MTTSSRSWRPKPPQLDQKIIDSSRPRAPTTMRITPIVWISRPDTLAFTAQVRMAPAAMRMMLTPIPMFLVPPRQGCGPQTSEGCGELRAFRKDRVCPVGDVPEPLVEPRCARRVVAVDLETDPAHARVPVPPVCAVEQR